MVYSKSHSNRTLTSLILAAFSASAAAQSAFEKKALEAATRKPVTQSEAFVMATKENKMNKFNEDLLKEAQKAVEKKRGRPLNPQEIALLKQILSSSVLVDQLSDEQIKALGLSRDDLREALKEAFITAQLTSEVPEGDLPPSFTSPSGNFGGATAKSAPKDSAKNVASNMATDTFRKDPLLASTPTPQTAAPMAMGGGQNPDAIEGIGEEGNVGGPGGLASGNSYGNGGMGAGSFGDGDIGNRGNKMTAGGGSGPRATPGQQQGGGGDGRRLADGNEDKGGDSGGHANTPSSTVAGNDQNKNGSERALFSNGGKGGTTNGAAAPAVKPASYNVTQADKTPEAKEAAVRQLKFAKPTYEALKNAHQENSPEGIKLRNMIAKNEEIAKANNVDLKTIDPCHKDCREGQQIDKNKLKQQLFREAIDQGAILNGSSVKSGNLMKIAMENFSQKYVLKNKKVEGWPTEIYKNNGLIEALKNPNKDVRSKFISSLARFEALNEHLFPKCKEAPVLCTYELEAEKELGDKLSAFKAQCDSSDDLIKNTQESWIQIRNNPSKDLWITGALLNITNAKSVKTVFKQSNIDEITKLKPFAPNNKPIQASVIFDSWNNSKQTKESLKSKFCEEIDNASTYVYGLLLKKPPGSTASPIDNRDHINRDSTQLNHTKTTEPARETVE